MADEQLLEKLRTFCIARAFAPIEVDWVLSKFRRTVTSDLALLTYDHLRLRLTGGPLDEEAIQIIWVGLQNITNLSLSSKQPLASSAVIRNDVTSNVTTSLQGKTDVFDQTVTADSSSMPAASSHGAPPAALVTPTFVTSPSTDAQLPAHVANSPSNQSAVTAAATKPLEHDVTVACTVKKVLICEKSDRDALTTLLQNGDLDQVCRFLERNFFTSDELCRPLWSAALDSKQNEAMVRALLHFKLPGLNQGLVKYGRQNPELTPLHTAIQQQQFAIALLLVQGGAKPGASVSSAINSAELITASQAYLAGKRVIFLPAKNTKKPDGGPPWIEHVTGMRQEIHHELGVTDVQCAIILGSSQKPSSWRVLAQTCESSVLRASGFGLSAGTPEERSQALKEGVVLINNGPRASLIPYAKIHTDIEGSLPGYIAECDGTHFYWICAANLTVVAWSTIVDAKGLRDALFGVLGQHADWYNQYKLL